jgi:NAD(P)-dependent dehydrogenase (short-subunit alcohol dehydrogenase family)
MKKHGRRGSIIATTSNASEITCPIVATPYMPAKAGVRHLVRQLARELAPFGIA